MSAIMTKEALIAIFVGFALGLIVTFGIWQANKTLTATKKQTIQEESLAPEEGKTTPEKEPSPTPSSFSLIISKPEDESIANKTPITVSGITEPNTQIVIIGEKEEKITEADESGIFTSEISLVSGVNEITITAFSEKGDEVSKTLNVVYSTLEI